MKTELEDLRSSSAAPEQRDAARIAELERLVAYANEEIQRRAERLHAVEDQVSQAVGRLQQAHVDLHSQTELVRSHSSVIYQIERLLDEDDGSSPEEALEKIRSKLASTRS